MCKKSTLDNECSCSRSSERRGRGEMTSIACSNSSTSPTRSNFEIADWHTATNTPRPRQLSTNNGTASTSSSTGGNSHNNHPSQLLPRGTQVLFQSGQLSVCDEFLVIGFSLIVFSSVVWVPWAIFKIIYIYYWRERTKCRNSDGDDDNDDLYQKRKKVLRNTILVALMIGIMKPYANARVGRWLNVRRWRIWKAWLNYVSMEVLLARTMDLDGGDDDNTSSMVDNNVRSSSNRTFDWKNDPAIFAIIPHGLFPFSLAFAALADKVFGIIHPVTATATSFFPFVREILGFLENIDATKAIVDTAIQKKSRIGLSPGGIAEMFVPTTHPNEEYALLAQRKGFIRMSVKHNVPIVPIYVFGATKMFHRLSLPTIFEKMSKWFKLSLCIFYGRLGLPIPFRQKLLYVIGHPLFPPSLEHNSHCEDDGATIVNDFHQLFCDKIVDLFNSYKKYYGWEHKRICII